MQQDDHIQVPVKRLNELWKVLQETDQDTDVWGGSCTLEDILEALDKNNLESRPFSKVGSGETYNHAARIAFLVKHPDDEPIEIDVGVPSLGYYIFRVLDGNHRLAAATIRGDRIIKVDIQGEVSYAKHLFIKPLKKYTNF